MRVLRNCKKYQCLCPTHQQISLNTNLIHQQMVVKIQKGPRYLVLSTVGNLQVIDSSNRVIKATPE